MGIDRGDLASRAPKRRPYEFTLTPTDRAVFEKCLLAISIFYGSLALLIVGISAANQHLTVAQRSAGPTASSTTIGHHAATSFK
jgi:hypothetical protein